MNRERIMRGMLVGCILMVTGGGWDAIPVKADGIARMKQDQVIISEEEERNERIAQMVWYYKEVNGKRYRRLYDATNQEWVTDWILCE